MICECMCALRGGGLCTDTNWDLSFSFLQRSVVQELLDKIDVRQQHSSAAVALEAECIQCISFSVFSLKQTQVGLPFVTNHLPAGEAANWNNHIARKEKLPALTQALLTKGPGRKKVKNDNVEEFCLVFLKWP
eukprot:scpid103926/ scgid18524/ 